MLTKELFQKKHELFLSMLFGSFSISDEGLFDILYDFALIEYRHLNWLGTQMAQEKIEFNYDYDRSNVKFEAKDNFELFELLKEQIKAIRSYLMLCLIDLKVMKSILCKSLMLF